MQFLRAIVFVAVAALAFPGGGARAEESASAPVVAAAGELTPAADDSAPATKGDVRRLNGRIDQLDGRIGRVEGQLGDLNVRMVRMEERLNGLEQRMDNQERELRGIRAEMHMNFRWLMAAILAVLGLPHFFGWMTRMRADGAGGRTIAAAVLTLVVLAGGAALAVAACEADAAMAGNGVPSISIQAKLDGAGVFPSGAPAADA